MLIRDCLAKVIQLVSRNTLKVEDFKDCETTCDVLDDISQPSAKTIDIVFEAAA